MSVLSFITKIFVYSYLNHSVA